MLRLTIKMVPMILTSPRTIALTILLLIATRVDAQTTWRDLPCAESKLWADGALKCQVQAPLVTSTTGAEVPTNYSAVGTLKDTIVNLRLAVAKAPNHFRPYPEQEAVRTIRGFSGEVMGAGLSEWSGPSAQRALTYLTFRTKDRACIGFDIPGPPHVPEAPAHLHAWILRGVICPPDGQPINRRAVIRYLESIRVSVQNTPRNILGTDLQPWP